MGQCFQDVGLTKWTSIITKQCPNNADRTKANFNECIRDYLEAVAGFSNIGDQLIHWLCTPKKPTLMAMHKFMRRQVQLLSYLKGGYLRQTMEVPTTQEKSEQIFFAQPKAHQNKFMDLNQMVPKDPIKLIAFFKQCQATDKSSGVLKKIAKDKKQPKEKKTLIFLSRVAMNQATSSIVATNIAITIKATYMIAMIADLIIVIKTIDATIVLNATTRTQRATCHMKRRMIASAITSRKRVTRPCIMTGPLHQAPAIPLEEGVDLVQDPLCALVLVLGLA